MSRPLILIVDDEPDRSEFIRPLLHSHKQEVEVEILHPRDVKDMHLSAASVIVVDHYLEDWEERDSQIPSLRIKDGMALAAALRSQVNEGGPSPAIVLRTAWLEKLRGDLPSKSAPYLIAWQHDIEWVLSKADQDSTFLESIQLIEFARAVARLEGLFYQEVSMERLVSDWLNLDGPDWFEVALDDVSETRPPIHSVAQQTHGASIMRWFLHRILPYPTFLLNDRMIAIKLRVTYEWLMQELTENSELSQELNKFRYQGAFSEFDGCRWWRAGLTNFIVRVTDGRPFDFDTLREAVSSKSCTTPTFLPYSIPVLAVDPDTMQSTQVVNADQAKRITLDGWPTFADDAWVTRSDIIDKPHFADLVIDRFDLESA